MQKLIETTLAAAREQYLAYGFDDSEIETLLGVGERDLRHALAGVEKLLDSEDREALDDALHAVRGLLLHMGNSEAAENFTELRFGSDDVQSISKIRTLLSE